MAALQERIRRSGVAQGQLRCDWCVTEGTSAWGAISNIEPDFHKLRLEPNCSSFVSSVNSYLLLLPPPGREAMVFLSSMDCSQRSSPDNAGQQRCWSPQSCLPAFQGESEDAAAFLSVKNMLHSGFSSQATHSTPRAACQKQTSHAGRKASPLGNLHPRKAGNLLPPRN